MKRRKQIAKLLLDTKTGFLYAPKWTNDFEEWRRNENEELNKFEKYVSHLEIVNFRNWEIVENGDYPSIWEEDEPFYLRNTMHKIGLFNIPLIGLTNIEIEDNMIYKYILFEFQNYINLYDRNEEWIKVEFQKLSIEHKMLKFYFSANENSYTYKPFIYNPIFESLNIWGDNFTNEKFIAFLQENSFHPNVEFKFSVPKERETAYRSIPTVLKELRDGKGISLHTEKIIFPNELFSDNSLISKYENLISYIDFLLWKVEEFSKNHSQQLSATNELSQKVSNLQSEKVELLELKNYLISKTDYSFLSLEKILTKHKKELSELLESFHSEATTFFSSEESSIFDFSPKIQNFDFSIIGETLTNLYNSQVDKVLSFSGDLKPLLSVAEQVERLFSASNSFYIEKRENLRYLCKKEYVDESFEQLFGEWSLEIEKIESRYLPILKAYFEKKISGDTLIHTFTLFENFRESINNFFESERISLIQKYDSNPKSELLQKAEMEIRVFQCCSEFGSYLQDRISEEEQQTTKKILNSQAQTLFSQKLANYIDFSTNAGVSEEIRKGFHNLQEQTLEIYLADAKKYDEELQKRNSEIQSLLFKMKKDLERQTNSKYERLNYGESKK